jgi:heme O synthase-like polyprenyltransferase
MLLIRVIGLLAAVGLGVSVLLYMLSGERRYLLFAWRLFKYSIFVLALILMLFLGERLLVMM